MAGWRGKGGGKVKEESCVEKGVCVCVSSVDHTLVNEGDGERAVMSSNRLQGMSGGLGARMQRKATDKLFVCDECGKDFNRRYNLKIHLRVHTGETPYLCPKEGCKKKFMWRSSLLHHTRLHEIREGQAMPSTGDVANGRSISALEASDLVDIHRQRSVSLLEASDVDGVSSRELASLRDSMRRIPARKEPPHELSSLCNSLQQISCLKDARPEPQATTLQSSSTLSEAAVLRRDISSLSEVPSTAQREISSLSETPATVVRDISSLSDDSCFSDFTAAPETFGLRLPEGFEVVRF